MNDQESEWAAGAIEQAKRDHKTILALREQLDRVRTERDEARAELKRYTDVYGDPDAPVDLSSFAVGKPDAPPLFPGLAAMADRVITSMEADAPAIKVGDHVRCESLGNLTGIVETVNPSEVPGWDQCLVRDDAHGHVWGAASWILEVLP
jgi:hypothetical protein